MLAVILYQDPAKAGIQPTAGVVFRTKHLATRTHGINKQSKLLCRTDLFIIFDCTKLLYAFQHCC